MTFRTHLKHFLSDHCLHEPEVNAIIKEMEDTYTPMRGRWYEEIAGYPPVTAGVLRSAARAQALKWIEANAPEHIARMMLTNPQ